jgi:hypothetical protein
MKTTKWWSGIWSGASKRILQVLMVLLVLLWALPEIVRISLLLASPRLGLGELALKDIDINFFSGRVAIKELQLSREGEQALRLEKLVADKGWLGWVDGEWQLEELSLNGAQFVVRQTESGAWDVVMPIPAGEERPDQEQTAVEIPKLTVKKLQISDSQIGLAVAGISGQLVIQNLNLEHVSTWRSEPAELELSLFWNEAKFDLKAEAQSLLDKPEIKGELHVQQLQAADFSSLLPAEVKTVEGQLSTNLIFAARQFDEQRFGFELEGMLALNKVSTQYQHLQLDSQNLTWRGVVDAAFQEGALSFLVNSLIENQKIRVTDTERELALLQWDQFTINSLTVNDKNTIKLEGLRIEAPAMLSRKQDKLLSMSALTLDRLSLEEGIEMQAGVLEIHDGQYRLVINPEGHILLQ